MKLRGSIVRFALMLCLGAFVLLNGPQRAEAISYCCLDCEEAEVACYASCNGNASCITDCENSFYIQHCWRFCSFSFCKDECGGCPPGLTCMNGECYDLGGGGPACSSSYPCPQGMYCSGDMCVPNPTCPVGQFPCNGVCVTIGVPCPN